MAKMIPQFGSVACTLVGTNDLLMHNERLANPMDPAKKRLSALTGKRGKTDDDHALIARAEFDGGLYIDDDGPFVPSHWITAMIRDGAKQMKLGKAVTQGVFISIDSFPLQYEGPRTADGLWEGGFFDQRMVGNQKVRVLRTRPRFPNWSLAIEIEYDPSVFDTRQLIQIMDVAGKKIGLGDYRPRFGRFLVEYAE